MFEDKCFKMVVKTQTLMHPLTIQFRDSGLLLSFKNDNCHHVMFSNFCYCLNLGEIPGLPKGELFTLPRQYIVKELVYV